MNICFFNNNNNNILKHSYFDLYLLLQNLNLLGWDLKHGRKTEEKEHLLIIWCVSDALEMQLYLILKYLIIGIVIPLFTDEKSEAKFK